MGEKIRKEGFGLIFAILQDLEYNYEKKTKIYL